MHNGLTPYLGRGLAALAFAMSSACAHATTLIEDFANGANPPILNAFYFNHAFTLPTAYDLGGASLGDPLPQTPPFALTLYSGNEDRVTFNLPSATDYVEAARVWAYADPPTITRDAATGRVVFEGTGGSKTFDFVGGPRQWRLFEARSTDLADNGNLLGEITAVVLDAVSNPGNRVMFDDLEVDWVSPPARGDLSLTMNGPASPVAPGDVIDYVLTVANAGPNEATGVSVTAEVPFGTTFVPAGSSAGCSLLGRELTCTVGTLGVGATAALNVRVQVGPDACATVRHRATVSGQVVDTDTANNTAVHEASTALPACADFSVAQTALPVPPVPGEDALTYTLTARNNGPDASDGSLTFTLPTHVVYDSFSADSDVTCTPSGSVVSCTLPTLVAGQQKRILVTGPTLATMNGIQTSTVQIAPAIDDPAADNNRSRFRFSADSAYEYTIVGELGVGSLVNFSRVGGVAINNSGEVAFHVSDEWSTDAGEFAIFRGDGSGPLTTITHSSDYPALPDDQHRVLGYAGAVDINDPGVVAFTEEVRRDLPAGHEVLSTSIRTSSGHGLTTVAADSAASGVPFRHYVYATIDSRGRVAANYNDRFGESAVVLFDSGRETSILAARSDDYVMDAVGLSNYDRYIAHLEVPIIGRGRFYTLERTLPTGTRVEVAQAPGRVDDAIFVHPHVGVSDFGSVIYSRTLFDPLSQWEVEELRIGNEVMLSGLGLPGFEANFGAPKLNNEHRYLFKSSYWSPVAMRGLFTGPHPVANRVVRTGVNTGDLLFGSRVDDLIGWFAQDINDSGQVAFAVELANNRRLILRADPVADVDQDGVIDWTELGAANQGDGNGDAIPDSAQPHVASTTTLDRVYPVTFVVDPDVTLGNVAPVANPSPHDAPGVPFPAGHFAFEVRDLAPGGRTTVTVTLPSFMSVHSWWKYGRTAAYPFPHWYEFDYDGSTGAVIDGNVVTLHLQDGARGDDDLTENGIIVDPGAPGGFAENTALPDRDGDGTPDTIDNCPAQSNASQADIDGDLVGDRCDDDIDGDGMDNTYETDNGLDPYVDDADGDLDRDGATNLEEFLADTGANDPGDTPPNARAPAVLQGVLPLLLE
jgi:uncharacterized repeat protein (TIGR01451 family)